jgi:hypothetical protein
MLAPMFRFSIRDVLWLTVVVALGVGWWIDHSRTAKIHTLTLRLLAEYRVTVDVRDGMVLLRRNSPDEQWDRVELIDP